MRTDAQTQEGDRKGAVRQRPGGWESSWAGQLRGPQLPALGASSSPFLSSLPQANSLLQSSQQHTKAQPHAF